MKFLLANVFLVGFLSAGVESQLSYDSLNFGLGTGSGLYLDGFSSFNPYSSLYSSLGSFGATGLGYGNFDSFNTGLYSPSLYGAITTSSYAPLFSSDLSGAGLGTAFPATTLGIGPYSAFGSSLGATAIPFATALPSIASTVSPLAFSTLGATAFPPLASTIAPSTFDFGSLSTLGSTIAPSSFGLGSLSGVGSTIAPSTFGIGSVAPIGATTAPCHRCVAGASAALASLATTTATPAVGSLKPGDNKCPPGFTGDYPNCVTIQPQVPQQPQQQQQQNAQFYSSQSQFDGNSITGNNLESVDAPTNGDKNDFIEIGGNGRESGNSNVQVANDGAFPTDPRLPGSERIAGPQQGSVDFNIYREQALDQQYKNQANAGSAVGNSGQSYTGNDSETNYDPSSTPYPPASGPAGSAAKYSESNYSQSDNKNSEYYQRRQAKSARN